MDSGIRTGRVMGGVSVSWTSIDASVATVSAAGLVTAVGNGSTSVAAAAGGARGSATITVAQRIAEVAMSPASDTLVALGDTVRLVATAADANGNSIETAEFSWGSGDESVATVDAVGLVTAVGNGTTSVTATAGATTASARVMVAQRAAAIEVTPELVALSFFGDMEQLSATASDANGHAIQNANFYWRSGDTNVAVVDTWGTVTAVGSGSASIIASVDDAAGNAIVTVPPALSTDGGFLGHVSMVDPPSNAPNWTTFGPANVTIPTASIVGDRGTMTIRVRDHACEDGDRVAILIYNAQSRSWFQIFRGEIFNHWQTRTYQVTAGYHYIVDVHALNGTGYKGNCSFANVNTGEVFISNLNDRGSGAIWGNDRGCRLTNRRECPRAIGCWTKRSPSLARCISTEGRLRARASDSSSSRAPLLTSSGFNGCPRGLVSPSFKWMNAIEKM